MRTFGGKTPTRNAAFGTQFAAINGVTGSVYWAAGFTELKTSKPNIRKVLSALAKKLDPGLKRLVVIQVGTSGLGYKEFIGIAWDPNWVTVEHAGIVYREGTFGSWTPHNVEESDITDQTILLPSGSMYTLDTRGLAYIACRDEDDD